MHFLVFYRAQTTPGSRYLTTPTAPSSSPSSEPSTTTETVSSGSNGENIAAGAEKVAAAMVGVASSIIVCALVLYASDLRDRYNHEKWASEQRRLQEVADDNSTEKSACHDRSENESNATTGSTAAESGYWVQVTSNELVEYTGGQNRQNILPPLLADEPREEVELALTCLPLDDDDNSISRVSTLTASFMEGGFSYADIEEKMSRHAIESSSDVTELDDYHRVADDTALRSLIKDAMDDYEGSVCSSLTNASSTRLRGEECLDLKGQAGNQTTPDSTPLPSLEVSPDTPLVDDDGVQREGNATNELLRDQRHADTANGNELAQLEQLIAGIPFDEMSYGTSSHVTSDNQNDNEVRDEPEETEAYLRDVCFVPCASGGNVSLGLLIYDAPSEEGYPTVAHVDFSGPLAGQLFIGNAILAVNDTNTTGLSSEEVMELFERSDSIMKEPEHAKQMIKLTVMSLESDGGSSSDGQQSLDLGFPESAEEV